MDHVQYSLPLDYANPDEEFNPTFGIEDVIHHEEISSITTEKVGDELLIDMVRSRPYLYNKALADYRNTGMKENAWREIATVMNIPASECQSRWIRLRQHYSKERQQRQLETRSGAGKSTRKKWFLYESLAFLDQHVAKRQSYTNVALKASATTIPQSTTSQQAAVSESVDSDSGKENGNLRANYDELPVTSLLTADDRNVLVASRLSNVIPANQCGRPVTPSASSSSTFESESSRQTPTPVTPMRCYLNDDKKIKRPKVDPVETAFHRMNSTITEMVDKICSKPAKVAVSDDNDPDVIIGKLVTAELKNAAEPKKAQMKKKFMSILYSLDED